jgi:hypothetical protein
VNQAEITAFVIERLSASSERDPHAWYPATGWMDDDGPFGLAIELFGDAWSNSQLDQLARVLFLHATEGKIEVAEFRKTGKRKLPSRPFSQDSLTVAGLLGPGSRHLDVPNNQYGARLAVGSLDGDRGHLPARGEKRELTRAWRLWQCL